MLLLVSLLTFEGVVVSPDFAVKRCFFYGSKGNPPKNTEYFLALGSDMMIGEPFNILSSIDSTNNHAMRLAKTGEAKNGCVFFAEEQTHGKGQRGRNWHSQAGQNIMMSIVLTGKALDLKNPFSISCLIAVSAHELLTCSGSDDFSIKWPNDIYWRDRKAGGILIENVIRNGIWKIAVVGIGININQTVFEHHPSKAVSIKQITGRENDPIELAKHLCRIIDRRLEHHLKTGEFGLDHFSRNLFKKGERTILDYGCGPQAVEILNIDNKGHLLISTETGEKTLESGNVQWML